MGMAGLSCALFGFMGGGVLDWGVGLWWGGLVWGRSVWGGQAVCGGYDVTFPGVGGVRRSRLCSLRTSLSGIMVAVRCAGGVVSVWYWDRC
ncbi:hypothetical protein Tco_0212942 [Tanacetum coccineum]